MRKFFSFRSTAAGADNLRNEFLMVPVDEIIGMQAPTDTTIEIWFDNIDMEAGSWPGIINNHNVTINIKSGSKKRVMKRLAELSNASPHDDGVVVVADNATNTYCSKDITSCGAIGMPSAISIPMEQ
jgi:hypothetical protein